jgi:nucleoside-diphosphate-sugar epimerase
MRVFLTGATGFVGSAIVPELIDAGHQVLGLARSEEAAKKLSTIGVDVHRGDLENLVSLQAGAAACDAVIHTGFIHDFARYKEVCEIDRRVIEAIGKALEGTKKPFIITSGTALLKQGTVAKEEDMNPLGPHPRFATEEAADLVTTLGVRVGVVRLPPSVHGEGDYGFVPMLINLAREKGVAAYIGEGLNRWPAVHRLDAAHLFRLVLENDFAAGTRFHAAAEEGVAFKDIAAVIGKHLQIPVVSKSSEEAAEHFGWFAGFAGTDNPTSSKKTQESLGWKAVQPGLIADIGRDSYYKL